MPQILRRLPCRKPAQSASTNLSRLRNIPSTNSEDAIRTASEEHVSDVPRLEPPRYSPTITRADKQHEAPTEMSALIGGGCTTTGAPSDSHTGSRMPTVNCSVRPCGQSLLKVNDPVSMLTMGLISTAPMPDIKPCRPAHPDMTLWCRLVIRRACSCRHSGRSLMPQSASHFHPYSSLSRGQEICFSRLVQSQHDATAFYRRVCPSAV